MLTLRRRPSKLSLTQGTTTGLGHSGFTLLEVLIATVVLAAGAAGILGHVYQLLDYSHRARGHRDEVRYALNRAAELSLFDPNRLSRSVQQDSVLLVDKEGKLIARLENHPFEGVQVPVSVGFGPLQEFHVPAEGRYTLSLIGRGIREQDGL